MMQVAPFLPRRVSSPLAFATGGTLRQQAVANNKRPLQLINTFSNRLKPATATSFFVAKANKKETLRGRGIAGCSRIPRTGTTKALPTFAKHLI